MTWTGLRRPWLGAQTDQDIVLAGGGQVRGRIGLFEDQIDVLAAERFFKGGDFDRPLQFDCDQEGVAVEDGRVNDLQGQLGPRPPVSAS